MSIENQLKENAAPVDNGSGLRAALVAVGANDFEHHRKRGPAADRVRV